MKDGFCDTQVKRKSLTSAERAGILDRVRQALAGEGVVFAYAFGSFAEDRPFHDLDIAVYLNEQVCSPESFLEKQMRLTADLEKATGLAVDVVILNDAPIGLRLAAVKGVLIHSNDEEARCNFVERTCLEYADLEPWLRASLNDLLS